MSHSRRQSLSSSWIESHGSWMDTVRLGSQSPSIQISSPGPGGSNPNLIRAGVITPVKEDVDTWVKEWESVLAKDLIDSRIVTVDADATVEEACEILLKEDIPCLVVTSSPSGSVGSGSAPVAYNGLFDFSDVNAFLTLAATRHNIPHQHHQPSSASSSSASPSEVDNNASAGGATPSIAERASEIIEAAKAGKVAVGLVSNFSQKNPFKTLPNEATVIDLLRLFSTGVHRAAIGSRGTNDDHAFASYEGLVSDRALLSYFSAYASRTPSFLSYLNNTLHNLHTSSSSSPILTSISLDKDPAQGGSGGATPILLPSLYIYSDIVAAGADQPVLDAMKLMSEEGVSSIAVVEGGENGAYAGGYVPGMGTGYAGASGGGLVSAVSVTDVGKIVVPSESKQILYMPLQQFVALIKAPQGSTDGEETYPVYSLSPSSRLSYAIDKLLATNAHRLFITEDSRPPSNTASPVIKPIGLGGPLHGPGHSPGLNAGLGRGGGNRLSGIVSIVDILTVFAHIAALPAHEIDPTRQKRHRRISSNSSQSSAASSPSHSLSSSMTEQELLRSAHSVSPVLGALGLGVGVGMGGGPGVGMGSPLGRSTSKSNLASRGTNRMSGSFVLPGPIVPGHSVLGLGDVGASLGVGAGKGASRREGGKSPAAGVDIVDKGVAGLQVGSVDGEKE